MTKQLECRVTKGGCWEVVSHCCNQWGYPMITRRGRRLQPHRLLWAEKNGPVPRGMFICHTCDNPRCINPDHLFLGSHQDNMADMRSKGRSADHSGEKNNNAILDWPSVRQIRWRYEMGEPVSVLADDHNVAVRTVQHVVSGRTWIEEGQ